MPIIGNLFKESFPDSVVVGEGAVAYVIPAGFNADVYATMGNVDFSVNGQTILSADSVSASWSGVVGSGTGGISITVFTNNTGRKLLVSGSLDYRLHVIVSTNLFAYTRAYIDGVLVNSTSGNLGPYVYNFSNVELNDLGTVVGQCQDSNPANSVRVTGSGSGQSLPLSLSSVKAKLLAGDTIIGGRYIVGLYAI